jgi:hypothetical protein
MSLVFRPSVYMKDVNADLSSRLFSGRQWALFGPDDSAQRARAGG